MFWVEMYINDKTSGVSTELFNAQENQVYPVYYVPF